MSRQAAQARAEAAKLLEIRSALSRLPLKLAPARQVEDAICSRVATGLPPLPRGKFRRVPGSPSIPPEVVQRMPEKDAARAIRLDDPPAAAAAKDWSDASEGKKILQDIIPQMTDVLDATRGVGLAAPQVGVNKCFFLEKTKSGGSVPSFAYTACFNPQYERMGDETVEFFEGCLTYLFRDGGSRLMSLRWAKVRCFWEEFDADAGVFVRKHEIRDGFGAVVFQHETDHVFGRTIFSRLRDAKKEGGPR